MSLMARKLWRRWSRRRRQRSIPRKKQGKAAFESAKKQFGYADSPAGAAADSIERGFEVMVDAQKDLLDVLSGPGFAFCINPPWGEPDVGRKNAARSGLEG